MGSAVSIVVCVAASSMGWSAGGAASPPEIHPPRIDGPGRSFDEPDAAALHYRRKREGNTPNFNTVAAYEKALAQLDRMPRYSTRLGAHLAGRSAGGRASIAKFVGARALGQWEAVGPGNIGGRTRTLVIHPLHPEIMYAGGVSGGVWKTTDGGASWAPVSDRLANIAVNSMAIHPEDPDILFIGTGEGYFREIVRGTWLPLRGAGIYKTTDGGATWSRLPRTDGPDFHWVNDLVISPLEPDRIYAATRTGVQLSEDGGESWIGFLDPDVNGGCLDLALRTDQPVDWIYAACGTFEQATVYRRKMFRTGLWDAVLSEPGMGRTTLAIAPSDQSVIYALSASNDPGPNGVYEQGLLAVYRSTAGGNPSSWRVQVDNTDSEKLNTLLLTNAGVAVNQECGWEEENTWVSMGWYCNVIAVDPVDPDIVWAAGVDLFRSDDGGQSWGPASYWWGGDASSYVHADQHAIVFHPDYDGTANTTMFTASDGGVFRTHNPNGTVANEIEALCDPAQSGVEFTRLNHNLGITQFYHGAVYPGADRYIGGTQDNGTLLGTDDAGHDGWLHVSGGDGGYVAVDPANPERVYAESQRFYFKRSTDGGQTFEVALDGITEAARNFLFITPFVMDPNQPRRLWAGGRRLWRTDDGATRWNAASETSLGTGQVSALAVAPGNSQSVIVGTTDGFIYRNDRALETGATTQWASSRPREGFVTSLAFDPSNPGVVFATFAEFGGRHVWRSGDDGETWEAIDGTGTTAVPDIPVHSIVIDPDDPRRLYLGTDLGVMVSVNGGATWAVENTGFANAVTEWLTLGDDGDGQPWLFAFTHGRGAWRVRLQPLPPSPRTPGGRQRP
jgi:photosystem II stability/assembly factor-like uncharacterized protein